mmetsp:Transcript_98969/g.206278  ORF Transcript_98969/g.206278 Transcript_98969/m.206278 type:complete len:320 (-) Transcript_98969:3742-4701(-)
MDLCVKRPSWRQISSGEIFRSCKTPSSGFCSSLGSSAFGLLPPAGPEDFEASFFESPPSAAEAAAAASSEAAAAVCLLCRSLNLCSPSKSPLLNWAPAFVRVVTTASAWDQCAHIKAVIFVEDLLALFRSPMAPAQSSFSAASASLPSAANSNRVGPCASATAVGSGRGPRQAGQEAPFVPSARQRPRQLLRWKVWPQDFSFTIGASSLASHKQMMQHSSSGMSVSALSPSISLRASAFKSANEASSGALLSSSKAVRARGWRAVLIIAGAKNAGISWAQFARFRRAGHFSKTGLINISRVPPRCAIRWRMVDPPGRPL